MSRRRAPSKGDRHHSQGTPVVSGNPGFTHKAVAVPPELEEGQGRCVVCRNGALLTSLGNLRSHRDLFGAQCYNRRPEGVELRLVETPDVEFPDEAKKGECRECGKWLPGERSLCGRCSVLRSA